jgi:hypothetical protein
MNFSENKPLLIALVACLTLVGSAFLAFLLQDWRALPLGFLLFPVLLLAWRNPRLGLLAFLVYLPLSSTVAFAWAKVYLVKGNMIRYTRAYPLYKTAKDVFYLPALAKILLRTDTFSKLRPKINPLLIAIAALTLSVLVTFFFINLGKFSESNFVSGLIGVKIILGYIPLIICGYYLINNLADLQLVSRLMLVMVIVCCGLAFVQYILLAQEICPRNFQLNEVAPSPELAKFFPSILDKVTLKAQCFVGGSLLFNPGRGLIRLPGTFSDPWQWSWFLISSSFITSAAVFSEVSRRWRLVSYLSIIFVLVATFISGQRIAFFFVPIFYMLLFCLNQKYNRWLLLKFALLSGASLLLVTQVGYLRDRWANFVDRWQNEPPIRFMVKQFNWLLNNRLSLFGQGLGRASSATRRLVSEEAPTKLIETYYVKLMYEMGIVGFISFLAVVTILTILTFKAWTAVKEPTLRSWGICMWVFVLFISFNPYYYPLAVEPVSVYYWLFAGMLLKLPELETTVEKLKNT